MRKTLLTLMALAVGGGAYWLAGEKRLEAADHTDPPAISANVKADLNDLFAWIDGSDLALALTIEKNAANGAGFSDAVQYVIHVDRGGTMTEVICEFDSTDNTAVRCYVGRADDFVLVEGDPSDSASPLTGDGIRIYAGLRNDPFFFNGAGLTATAAFVNMVAGTLTLDANGCPELDGATAGALVNCLTTQCDVGPGEQANAAAVDNFAGENVLALVVTVPMASVTGSGDTLKVWGSTHDMPQ